MVKFNKDICGEFRSLGTGGTEMFILFQDKVELRKAYPRGSHVYCTSANLEDFSFLFLKLSIKCLEESENVKNNLTFQQVL